MKKIIFILFAICTFSFNFVVAQKSATKKVQAKTSTSNLVLTPENKEVKIASPATNLQNFSFQPEAKEMKKFNTAIEEQARLAQTAAMEKLIDSLIKEAVDKNTTAISKKIANLAHSVAGAKKVSQVNEIRLKNLATTVADQAGQIKVGWNSTVAAMNEARTASVSIDTLTRQANKLEEWVVSTDNMARGFSKKLTNTWVVVGVLFLVVLITFVFVIKGLNDSKKNLRVLVSDYNTRMAPPETEVREE